MFKEGKYWSWRRYKKTECKKVVYDKNNMPNKKQPTEKPQQWMNEQNN